MTKTMTWRLVNAGEHDVLLYLHTTQTPTRAEWDANMEFAKQYARKNDVRRVRGLIVTDGGGPDTAMRSELTDFYKANRLMLKTAVVTTSLISRGIVGAIGLLNPHIKAFSPGAVPNALAHLDLPKTTAARILRELDDMQRELPPVACLTVMRGLASTATL